MSLDSSNVKQTVIGLLLHDVTDSPNLSGFQQPTAARYKHTLDEFRDYLSVVRESGLAVSTIAEPQSSQANGVVVQFTFDDGGLASMESAELLEDAGWRGVYFITTDLIGTRGFLTKSQVKSLHDRGHRIGSHSCSHPDIFRKLTPTQMASEWSDSRRALEDILGDKVDTASVPGGDCSPATIEQSARAGLTDLYTSEQLTRPWMQSGATCFGRLMMVNTTTPESLRRWLSYPRVGVLPERAIRFTKSSVKKMIGPIYGAMMKRRRALHESA